MVTLYGIKSCDTMKKARTWLEQHGVEFHFHDYKKDGLPEALADQWLQELGWETLINRRGTTWRQLPEEVRASMDNDAARSAMLANPSIIKRPLLDTGDGKYLGFKAEQYQQLFNL
ncbi:ArsC family reductase [Bacterioplanes sanyensis]|uniref:ArsC family reductase n=1 Tax=Bacterioplanes sanyensis TaxID=1249553 RepID=A0A222FQD1_9GAMM|nr:ArsC family reductase [Bacterioplanes sanyensis]ASP40443.1 ArsC family reductase [Bacterioplanes sanyensis]